MTGLTAPERRPLLLWPIEQSGGDEEQEAQHDQEETGRGLEDAEVLGAETGRHEHKSRSGTEASTAPRGIAGTPTPVEVPAPGRDERENQGDRGE